MLLDSSIFQFQALATRSEDLSPVSQQKTLMVADGPLKGKKNGDTDALDRPGNVDEALHYVAYLIFDRLNSLTLNHNHYSEGA